MPRFHHWTPDERAESVYQYLPFEVPPDCAGVRIRLDYDRDHGVLDLGCIDAVGWAGWSGGAKREVHIGGQVASPGYLPRGVPAGQWFVVLGLHRLPDSGLDCRVDIEYGPPELPPTGHRPPVPRARERRILPADDGLTWVPGDLHTHTEHSDGALSIDDVAALAVSAGLEFLAVTDHNTTSHHPHLPAAGDRFGIALVPGQEVTTADGHANAYGDIGWIDFRQPAATWAEEVATRGGLLSVNHPISGDCAWRQSLSGSPAIAEIWHSSWQDRRDGGALAWWRAHGLRPTPIGGSDWHRPGDAPPGSPTTWVACRDGDVLGGIRAGRTSISAGRDAPVLLRADGELIAVDADGTQLVCPDGRRIPVHGDLVRYGGHGDPHLLETNDRRVLAIVDAQW